MHQKQLELLKLLREATSTGRVVWRCEDSASHHAEVAGLRCSLRFKHPLLAVDDGSDADAVEITADKAVWTCYSGTEGFDLVTEILSAAYPEMREHNDRIAARLGETIEKLRKHTVQPGA
jgi:hypothetical protein